MRHYNDIPRSLQTYDASQLHPLLQDTVRREPALLEELTRSVDGLAQARRNLSDTEVAELVSFLEALTDPAARELSHLAPTRVPSGLPVGDWFAGTGFLSQPFKTLCRRTGQGP